MAGGEAHYALVRFARTGLGKGGGPVRRATYKGAAASLVIAVTLTFGGCEFGGLETDTSQDVTSLKPRFPPCSIEEQVEIWVNTRQGFEVWWETTRLATLSDQGGYVEGLCLSWDIQFEVRVRDYATLHATSADDGSPVTLEFWVDGESMFGDSAEAPNGGTVTVTVP